jgi:exodeoxyribonuclease VII large subunit
VDSSFSANNPLTPGLWDPQTADRVAPPASAVLAAPGRPAAAPVITVSQLNREAARLLQNGLGRLWVGGELSNVTRAASGHWYFTLKDSRACVRAVMFRTAAVRVAFVPVEGMQVEVLAAAGLYEARGEFQLTVERMREAGAGDLYRQFVRLKERLQAEGLFDADRKRPLPARIRRVGLVTSARGAAVHDVLATLRARAPRLEVILYPAAVQGERAPIELIAALDAAESRRECEVLLLIRGGGSIEDLRAFNDERLARRVAGAVLPIVCGVGHESDFSICDFVADLRATTPTAAAVAVSRDRKADLAIVDRLTLRLRTTARARQQVGEQTIDMLARRLRPPRRQLADHRLALGHLARRLHGAHDRGHRTREATVRLHLARLCLPMADAARARLDGLAARLARGARQQAADRATRLAHLAAALGLVNPRAVLGRGYALVHAADGRLVRAAGDVVARELLHIELAQGSIAARVVAGCNGASGAARAEASGAGRAADAADAADEPADARSSPGGD